MRSQSVAVDRGRGYSGSGAPSTLATYGTHLQVTNSLTINAMGHVTNVVGATSSGLDITTNSSSAPWVNTTSTVENVRGVQINFTANPTGVLYTANSGAATGVHWGLRWKGNHVSDLQALTNGTARLGWDQSGLSWPFTGKVAIFYDTGLGTPERPSDMTYVGFFTKPAFPGTVIRFR